MTIFCSPRGLAHQGHFQYETFDTLPEQVPLASVTVEFFLVRPIPQWRVYLAWHGVELYDLPLDMTVPQLSDFHAIGPDVQPRLDFGAFILCKIVNFLSNAHRSDTCITFLRNQLLFSSAFTTDHFHITPYDANLLIRHVFPDDQYPVAQLTSNTGYLLLHRAFTWVHQPHSLASLQKHASEPWIQLFDFVLTRPRAAADITDTSTDACAGRLLQLHPNQKSILQLYPDLAKDPALVSEYLLMVGACDRHTMPTCYGVQLSVVASCLVAHFQDEFGSVNIDQYLSQSDLLFILSAGGVYNGSLGTTRVFASDLFPLYASVEAFKTLHPKLLNMDYSVLILPPPKSIAENMTTAKWAQYSRKLLAVRPRDAYRKRKLAAFNRSPEFRTAFTTMSSDFNIDRLQRSAIVMSPDDCIRHAATQVIQSFRQLVTSAMTQASVQSVPTVQQTVLPAATVNVAPVVVSSTHHFDAPIRRLVPTFTDISSSLTPSYVETNMFALRAQQHITNWDNRSAYVFRNASQYLSVVQLHTTASRPFQLHDQLLFLQSGDQTFTPADPWGTLFAQRHYQYRVAQIFNDVLHCDFVELFYTPAQTEILASDIVPKVRCTYTGTYLLRVNTNDNASSNAQPPSSSVQHLLHELPATSATSAAPPTLSNHGQAIGRGSLSNIFRPVPSRQVPLATHVPSRSLPVDSLRPRDDDTDSDDSRQTSVKRLKDSQIEVGGKTYRVQGKNSVYTLIIAFASMCTLMEDGHIEKLLAGFGNYVNNYTSEILMKGILRQTVVSATLSGMQLHAPQNFALLRFKQLVWFELSPLHDKVFQIQWTYPDTWTPDDLHPIHFLSIHDATRKNFHFDYESWALSWIWLRITYEQILGPSYGPVLQDIVNDIQQNDIGQLFDVDYLVSLSIRMLALWAQYSSQHVIFKVAGSNVDYDPATMTVKDWQQVVHALWFALKSFLTFPLQHEFNILNDKFKVVKMKPLLPKDKRPSAQEKEKHPKALKSALKPASPTTTIAATKSRSKVVTPSRKVSIVTQDGESAPYCIKDFSKHYGITTSLKNCRANCKYIHYSKVPKSTTKASLLTAVDKLVTKLGLTDSQAQQFRSKIQEDPHFQ